MATELKRNLQTPNLEFWTGSVTASATFRSVSGRPVKVVSAMGHASAISTNAVKFTWVPDVNDESKFVLYCWQDDGTAATASTISISAQLA
tara:strand:+ start:818 stop:1090 length:273 start_codon:yes stop_codon:yes gene_type:complete